MNECLCTPIWTLDEAAPTLMPTVACPVHTPREYAQGEAVRRAARARLVDGVLEVTPDQRNALTKLSHDCTGLDSFNEARWEAGLRALIGDEIVDQMKYKHTQIKVTPMKEVDRPKGLTDRHVGPNFDGFVAELEAEIQWISAHAGDNARQAGSDVHALKELIYKVRRTQHHLGF